MAKKLLPGLAEQPRIEEPRQANTTASLARKLAQQARTGGSSKATDLLRALETAGKLTSDDRAVIAAYNRRKEEETRRQAEQEQQRLARLRQNVREAFNELMNPGPSQQELARAAEQTRHQAEQEAVRTAAEDAREQHREYTDSEDYRQGRETAQQMADQMAMNTGMDAGFFLSLNEDPKEQGLRAAADYYENQEQALQDRHLMEDDLRELAGWSKEEQQLLMNFAANRFNTEMAPEGVPFSAQTYTQLRPLMEKYGHERVLEIAESFTRNQNAIHAQTLAEASAKWAGDNWLGAAAHSIGTVGANMVSAVTSPLGYLQEAGSRTGRYRTLDPNNMGNLPGVYAGAVRQQVAGDIEKGFSGKVGSTLYQAGMSAADNLARIAMGGGTKIGTLGLAATGSFSQTVSQASAQGATPSQAVALGLADAFIEVGTEYLPLDNLLKAGKGGTRSAGQAVKEALRQAGIEATSEEIGYLGSLAAEVAVLQEKSGYNQQIGELVANGMGYNGARDQALKGIWDEAVQTFSTSFLSGAMTSGAQSAALSVKDRVQAAREQNAAASQAEKVNQAIRETLGMEVEKNTVQQGGGETRPTFDRSPTYEELTKKSDLPVISIGTNSEGKNYAQLKADAKQKAAAEKWFENPHTNADTGMPIFLTEKTFTHAFSNLTKDFGTDTLLAMNHLPELVRNAVLINANDPKNTNKPEMKVYTFLAAIHGENGTEPVKLTVKEYDSSTKDPLPRNILEYFRKNKQTRTNNRLYDIKALEVIGIERAETEKEFGASAIVAERGERAGANSTPNSTIKVADLLDLVKGDARKYVPQKASTTMTESAGVEGAPEGVEDGSGFGDNAANAKYKSVGAAGQKFIHEVRRSKVYDNTYANATDEEIKAAGERAQELDPKIAEYDYISEKESLANARLRTQTAEDIAAEQEYLLNKQGWTGEDNDTAFAVLKQLQKSEDVAAFKALARAQRGQGTAGGQFIQSFAKYSRDATKAAVDTVEILDGLGKGDVPKKFWKKNGSFEAWKDDILKSAMQIANDIEALEDGDTDSIRKIIRQLANFRRTTAFFGMSSNLTKNAERILQKMDFNTAKDIACAQLARIPDDFRKRSKGEVIKTIRYQNMLSSLVTVSRNLVGNGTMGVVDAFSDATAGRFADLLLSKATGKRTVGNDIRYSGTYLKAARDAADMASLMAELDIPAEHEGKYTGRTRTFSPQGGPLSRFFSAYEKYMNYALQVSDEFFSGGTSGAVAKSLEALGAKSGLSSEEIAALGDRVGRRRTFKEGRKLARASSDIKKGLNRLGVDGFGAGDMLLAFAETPAEMGQVAIDYSGAGFFEGLHEIHSIIKDAKHGKQIDVERQRKAVSDFGRGVTGVGMIALFTVLAAKGLISVNDDEDKDKRGLEQSLGLSGAQFNLSATIRAMQNESTEWREDDLVMSIDFLQPFNSQMYIGYLLSQEEEAGLKEYTGASVRGIAQSILDIPMMGTFSDIADLMTSFGEVSDGDYSAVVDAAGQFIGNQASSFVPAWVRQTAQYLDPVYRDTSGENALEKAMNQIKATIPGLSKTLPAKYDGLGNLQTRYDDPVLGFFNTFLNPGALKRIQASDIADNLEKLGDKSVYPEYLAPKSFQVDGETVMVSGKEMTETYQKTYGENVAALYGGLMDNQDFQKLTKEHQIAALKQAKTYAAQLAKAAVSDFADVPEGTTEELTQGIIQKVAGADLTGAVNTIIECWREGYDDADAREALGTAWQTYKGLDEETRGEILEEMSGRAKTFLTAMENGGDLDTFLAVQKPELLATDALDAITESWREESDSAQAVQALEEAFETFAELAKANKKAVLEDTSGRLKYFFSAMNAGMDVKTFTQMYGEYYSIDQSEKETSEKAALWSHTLEKAREAGTITKAQRDVLKKEMVFYQMFPAGTEKFDQMVENGISADDAKDLGWLLNGIEPQEGYTDVRPAQKFETIAGSELSEADKIAVLKIYGNDAQDENLDLMLSMGFTAAEYAAAYRMYSDASGDGKKQRTIAAYMARFGVDWNTAKAIYEIYG